MNAFVVLVAMLSFAEIVGDKTSALGTAYQTFCEEKLDGEWRQRGVFWECYTR